eukprot:SAG25_NODE_1255_length_3483_cov_7.797226_1_plen_240_part_00
MCRPVDTAHVFLALCDSEPRQSIDKHPARLLECPALFQLHSDVQHLLGSVCVATPQLHVTHAHAAMTRCARAERHLLYAGVVACGRGMTATQTPRGARTCLARASVSCRRNPRSTTKRASCSAGGALLPAGGSVGRAGRSQFRSGGGRKSPTRAVPYPCRTRADDEASKGVGSDRPCVFIVGLVTCVALLCGRCHWHAAIGLPAHVQAAGRHESTEDQSEDDGIPVCEALATTRQHEQC